MSKVLVIILVFGCVFVLSQNVNNVRLVNHRQYMTNVFTEVAKTLEEREWCNLKIPEFEMEINDLVLSWQVDGRAVFSNGFAVSIQRLEVLEHTLAQSWSWNNTDGTGTVVVQGTLTVHHLTVGFDVTAYINDQVYHSTGTFLHDEISFNFQISRNTQTHDMTVTVAGTHPNSRHKMVFLPQNNVTSVIAHLYDANSTFTGITSWGPDVLEPITLDVVTSRVEFPVICYDCPITD